MKVVTDNDGELIPFRNLELKIEAKFMNATVSNNLYDNGEKYLIGHQGNRMEKFQRKMMMSKTVQNDSSVRFIVESETNTLYEMRFHKINHRGDLSLSGFEVDAAAFDNDGDSDEGIPQPKQQNTSGKKTVMFEEEEQDKTPEGELQR